MSIRSKILNTLKSDENTGFGSNTKLYGRRLFRKDGTPNLKRTGADVLSRLSWYHTMIHLPRWKFYIVILSVYFLVNILFTVIYVSIGLDQLGGMVGETKWEQWLEAFFFSAQTFTTVGYGRVNPHGILMSSVAALEAFLGVLNLAIATGLFYGRFSRPTAFIRYSEHAIIAPFKGGQALMFRLVPYKNTNLTDAEVKITVGLMVDVNGISENRFYNLDLQLSKLNSLNLSWTIVHPIDEKSPLKGLSLQDMKASNIEVMVLLKAFDETYSNTVVSRTSYIGDELLEGYKFIPMYQRSDNTDETIMNIDHLNAMEPATLPAP
ncbi:MULTISPECIES: ion channel [unclassified Paraflavitalea]|uniref:ion channel n=1 Tax=unclassified Paraflavitalea TaxID=2798305 RepID=UPI003D351099